MYIKAAVKGMDSTSSKAETQGFSILVPNKEYNLLSSFEFYALNI